MQMMILPYENALHDRYDEFLKNSRHSPNAKSYTIYLQNEHTY